VTPPADVKDVVLGPGDLWFGGGATRVRTLLGSCVAVTLWHPGARVGGMCHYVVPARSKAGAEVVPSGRYADEALTILLAHINASGTPRDEYEVKMFGGGTQFAVVGVDVAARNIDAGLALLDRHGLGLTSMHLGGTGHRQVVLEVWSGDVWLRHVERDPVDSGR
jgi:chemotaxis protein CheD